MSSQPHTADVWILEQHTLTAADIARCNVAISPAEKTRMGQFRFERDRDSYRAAHALARLALSWRERAVPPHAWVFQETSHGRPEIAARRGFPQLRFNISHTRHLVACIVTRELDCGVDVELIDRCSDLHDHAHSVLAPAELATIAGASNTERATLLCRYWTLKEAYAKALGLGMSLAFILGTVAAKWVVLGRIKPGSGSRGNGVAQRWKPRHSISPILRSRDQLREFLSPTHP